MNILVKKFGGTSVGTLERIQNVASIVKKSIDATDKVVVVVSAMSGVTNKLVTLSNSLYNFEGNREYDVIASAGEQVSAGLVAIALNKLGIEAKSYLAWQVPIITDEEYGQANILEVGISNLKKDIDNNIVPVICGFQGIGQISHSITTIGRGGSDLTAVAVASALKADMCEIYSDVDGVYTSDPNKVSTARLIDHISYNEMLELSLSGAKVLQARSVDYAMRHRVKIRAVSSFIDTPGTIVSNDCSSEGQVIGLGISDNLVAFQIPSSKYEAFIAQTIKYFIRIILTEKSQNNCIITINKQDLQMALKILQKIEIDSRGEFYNSPYTNISLVGMNIKNNHSILDKIKSVVSISYINSIFVLENSINILLKKQYTGDVINILYDSFFNCD